MKNILLLMLVLLEIVTQDVDLLSYYWIVDV